MNTHFFKRIINRILMRYFSVGQIATKDRSVYLTFDDGPEEGITQFILDELINTDSKELSSVKAVVRKRIRI